MNVNLSAVQFFAAFAPADIPGWFQHTPPPQPQKPKSPEAWGFEGNLLKEASAWVRDPIWDLTGPELQEFQKAWLDYWGQRNDWRTADDEARYFQWRLHYGEQMAAHTQAGPNAL